MNLFNLALRFWWYAKFWKNERTAADFGYIFLITLRTSNTRIFHVIQLLVILNNQWIHNLEWKKRLRYCLLNNYFFTNSLISYPLSWVIIKCKIKILRISNVVDILKIFFCVAKYWNSNFRLRIYSISMIYIIQEISCMLKKTES